MSWENEKDPDIQTYMRRCEELLRTHHEMLRREQLVEEAWEKLSYEQRMQVKPITLRIGSITAEARQNETPRQD